MREKRAARFLAASAARTSAPKRSEQTPACLLRSPDCLSFLFCVPLKTRCPSSHSNRPGQERGRRLPLTFSHDAANSGSALAAVRTRRMPARARVRVQCGFARGESRCREATYFGSSRFSPSRFGGASQTFSPQLKAAHTLDY